MAPVLRKYVKKMASRDIGFDEGVKMITDTCTKMIKNKMPKKLKDPGSFVLSVSILNQTFGRSLCDIGSGVNVMPYSVAKKLGMTEFADTSIVLILADRSCRIPKGILEDVPLRIGNAWIPADFVVLDYNDHNEPKDPLILGRSFLATAGALIDCRSGSIELRLDGMTLTFDVDKTLKKPTIDGQTFMVDTVDGIAGKILEEMNTTEVLEVVSKEGERVIMDKKVTTHGEGKQKTIVQPKLAKKSAAPSTAIKQKAPRITLPTPPLKQRYAHPKPSSKSPSIINNCLKGAESVSHLRKPRDYRRTLGFSIDDIAGKRSIPPRHRAHPGDIPPFLGRPHAQTAYTPPWMRRLSGQHLSDPPDA